MGVIISSVENTSYFVISKNKNYFFMISKNLFCDMKKIEFVISQNHEGFVISQIRFCGITNSILWYHKFIF